MTNAPLSYLPGVCKVNSAYASSLQAAGAAGRPASGRFTDMDGVRFVAGLPEKIGGFATATSSTTTGVPRGMKDWRDNQQVVYLGIGTNSKLYYYSQSSLTDITPWRGIITSTLTNPFSTVIGSTTVTVAHTAHGLLAGDYVMFTSSASVGSVTISGVYFIQAVTTNTYTILSTSAASSTVSGGGGTVSYTYYRVTLTNPFTTTSGSSTVTVTHTSHGASVGDYLTISSASAVGGLTLSGQYQVTGASANSYTITAASNASSSATGGGTPNIQYEISVGNVDGSLAFGYGTGGYGQNGYGTTGTTSALLAPRTWSLDHYGQQLIANPAGGGIYIWDPSTGGRAYPLYNAPTQALAMFVTPERFVFALGTDGISMRVRWADQTDYTQWTASAANTANARTLQEGSYLVAGKAVRDLVSLVWSNTAAYQFTYTGDNNVYSSSLAAPNTGLIGPLAACVVGGIAYWMGTSELWMWNGAVQALPSDDIRDFVYSTLNTTQANKIVVAPNVAKKEIWGFYCDNNSNEINRYWIYHIDQQCFSTGSVITRTSWVDRGLWPYPMATDATGHIYNQEYGNDANGSALDSTLTFSPVDISHGDKNMDVFSFIPDFQRQTGNVTLSISSKTYPQDTATVYGPYTIAADGSTSRIDLRIGGKLIGYTIESNAVGGDYRLGIPRLEVQPAGARR